MVEVMKPIARHCSQAEGVCSLFEEKRQAFNTLLQLHGIKPPDHILLGGRQSLKRWSVTYCEYYFGHGVIICQEGMRIGLLFGGSNDE